MNTATVPFFSIVDYVFFTIFRAYKHDPTRASRLTLFVIQTFQKASRCFSAIPESKLHVFYLLPLLTDFVSLTENILHIAIQKENVETFFHPEEVLGILAATLSDEYLCSKLRFSMPYLIYFAYRICRNIDPDKFRDQVAAELIHIATYGSNPNYCDSRMRQIADDFCDNDD